MDDTTATSDIITHLHSALYCAHALSFSWANNLDMSYPLLLEKIKNDLAEATAYVNQLSRVFTKMENIFPEKSNPDTFSL